MIKCYGTFIIQGQCSVKKKSCIRETLNLSTCADSSTINFFKTKYIKYKVRGQVSGVRCQVSRVTCHMSLTPTDRATDPPPANSPTMHSREILVGMVIRVMPGHYTIIIAICIIFGTLKIKYCGKMLCFWDETMSQLKSSKINV